MLRNYYSVKIVLDTKDKLVLRLGNTQRISLMPLVWDKRAIDLDCKQSLVSDFYKTLNDLIL